MAEKERGGCLTAWLIFLIVSSALGMITLPMIRTMQNNMPELAQMPDWYMPYSIVSSLLTLIFVLGIFRWKRWGLYGYFILALTGVALSTLISGPAGLIGLIGPLIMWLLVRGKWEAFE